MFVGGPEDIPIEGDEFEKSKPRVLSIAGYCFLSLIAHFFVQDVDPGLSFPAGPNLLLVLRAGRDGLHSRYVLRPPTTLDDYG
ncbi:hypothetical protein, conserved [Eimeria brunetti]|uniref:Uncharacterized protein n=1 Tax=Eimeria brunetti TaxID=51314 RepID=U6LVS7_9EIME|nr:hypothetical protein, conserved [Eimeria brunetti]